MLEELLAGPAPERKTGKKEHKRELGPDFPVWELNLAEGTEDACPAADEAGCALLACCRGTLEVRLAGGQGGVLREGEILLLGPGCRNGVVAARTPEGRGVWIASDGGERQPPPDRPQTGSGLLFPDREEIRALLAPWGGCAVATGGAWSEAMITALEGLSGADRGRYGVLKAGELLYLLCRGCLPLRSVGEEGYLDPYQAAQVRRVHDYMVAHLEEPLTISRLAGAFHISATSLKDGFRRLYGRPIHSYLRERRLLRAAELLTETSQSIVEISVSVGYGSVSQFGESFKRRFHMPPSRFRREMGKKKV